MTQEDLDAIIDACKPVPCIMVGGYAPSSPQENANRAWKSLSEKMGFDYMTVQPGNGDRFFTAVPSETEDQKSSRVAKEKETDRRKEIAILRAEIRYRQDKLDALEPNGPCS
jgi:hypothetical protein